MLFKHELSFLKAARCLCNFQHLLVEKLSLKGPTADEIKISHMLYCVPDAVEWYRKDLLIVWKMCFD